MPYVPHACRAIDRSVKSLSMLAPKSGDGEISGIAPGSSQTVGSSWPRALPVVYGRMCCSRASAAPATALSEVVSVKTSRSDGAVDTEVSHDGPGFGFVVSEVGPV